MSETRSKNQKVSLKKMALETEIMDMEDIGNHVVRTVCGNEQLR